MEQDVIDQLINRFAEKYPYKMAVPKQEPPTQQPQTHITQAQQPLQPLQPLQPPQLLEDEQPLQNQEPIQHQPKMPQSIQPEPKSEEEILLNQLEQLEQLQNIEFPNRPQHQEKGINMNFWLFVVLIIIIVGIIIYLIMRKR
jgi:hypothetical protein